MPVFSNKNPARGTLRCKLCQTQSVGVLTLARGSNSYLVKSVLADHIKSLIIYKLLVVVKGKDYNDNSKLSKCRLIVFF